jgi:hypothetical protein
MPLYFFRITNGELSGAAEHGIELSDRDSPWKELTRIAAHWSAPFLAI